MRFAAILLLAFTPLVYAQVNNVTSPQQSMLKDFVTPIGAALDVSTLDTKQKVLTLNFNPIPGLLAIDTTLVTPRVNDVLSNVIGNAQTIDKIEKNLSASDDVVVAVSFNRRTKRWGASNTPHKDLTALGIDLTTYLNNQPQLYATGIWHHRNPVVGPNASAVRLTWEFASQSLNDFYAHEGRDCGAACLDAFNAFMKRTPNAANAPRFNLALEYQPREKPATPSVVPGVTLKTPHRISGIAGVSFPFATLAEGKPSKFDFKVQYDGTNTTYTPLVTATGVSPVQRAIPPVTAPYDHIAVATTFTQSVTGRTSVFVSLVGTERVDQFFFNGVASRPQTTRKLAVHGGITYKLAPVHPQPCCCR